MICRECLARLPAHLDEPDLDVVRHLRECSACRREAALLERALAVLAGEPEPAAPDLRAGLWEQIADRRRAAAERARANRRERIWAGLLAVLLASGLAAYLSWRWPGLAFRWPNVTVPDLAVWPEIDWAALGHSLLAAPAGLVAATRAGWFGAIELLAMGHDLADQSLPVSTAAMFLAAVVCATAGELVTRRARAACAVRAGGR